MLCLFGCNLGVGDNANSSPFGTTSSQEKPALVVAWVTNGDLYAWQTGDTFARRVASGGVIRPYVSKGGRYIAFTRGSNGVPYSLWTVERDGTAEAQLVGQAQERTFIDGRNFIGDVVWYDDEVLYFNTLEVAVPSFIPRDDLYRANARIREVALLLRPDEGGRFSISPNGEHIVVVSSGSYGRQDGRIGVIDPLGQARVVNLLYYVGVATGADVPFYPDVFWTSDSAAVILALPDKDLVYNDTQDSLPATDLWQLPIQTPSGRTRIGSVRASFFGLPVYSDDASQLAFLVRDVASNRFTLSLAEANGDNTQAYESGELGNISTAHWLPKSNRFWFVTGVGAFYLGQANQPPTRLGNDQWREVLFLSDTAYLATIQEGDAFLVQWGNLENGSTLTLGSAPTVPLVDGIYNE